MSHFKARYIIAIILKIALNHFRQAAIVSLFPGPGFYPMAQ